MEWENKIPCECGDSVWWNKEPCTKYVTRPIPTFDGFIKFLHRKEEEYLKNNQ